MLVSVIMPAFNSQKYIQSSIESVLSQTYQELELIVVDDCSSDETESIVKSFILKDSRVKYYKNPMNFGVSESRNVGICNAVGEFISFIDSDDLWFPNKLEKQLCMYSENKEVGVFYSGYEHIDESGFTLGQRVIPPERISYKDLLKTNYIGCLTVLVNLKKAGKISFQRLGHEDYNLWLDLLKKNVSFLGTADILAKYRIHDSLSSNKLKAAKWRWIIYYKHQKIGFFSSVYNFIYYIITSVSKHL
jgi:teichuronic acid biosynthesis glycosyltransferase TuaG